jgi:ECF transporter S component (folate family)
MKKSNTLKIAVAAQLIALGVIISSLSFIIPISGIPAIRIDLIIIPVILAGIMLGKLYGVIVGTLVDIIAYFILFQGYGPFNPGFTINLAMTGFIAGFVFTFFRNSSEKKLFKIIKYISLSVFLFLFLYTVTLIITTSEIRFGPSVVAITNSGKLILILTVFAALVISMIFYFLIFKNEKFMKNESFYKYFLILTLAEFFIIYNSSLWIEIYTTIPTYVSVVSRFIRTALLFPFKFMLLILIVRASEKILHNDISFLNLDHNPKKTNFTKINQTNEN